MTATDVDFSDAADQCAGLRKLSMSGFACNFLGVLRVAGPTLEELKSFDMLTRGDFEKVRQLCPKLSSISLSARGDDGREVYADLPCSYGSQLRFSNLVVPTALCEKIVKSCPNLRCDLYWSHLSTALPLVKVLGPSVKSLCIRTRTSPGDLAVASNSLGIVEKLEMSLADDALSAMQAMFVKAMPLLVSLKLSIRENPDLSKV